ncbi:MAG TPA: hypothetical protein VMS08_03645 [Candidatus Saccharimonadia bacterium]|nr:hypothetical protein [Candidatus Saccharimonadia bacterium]
MEPIARDQKFEQLHAAQARLVLLLKEIEKDKLLVRELKKELGVKPPRPPMSEFRKQLLLWADGIRTAAELAVMTGHTKDVVQVTLSCMKKAGLPIPMRRDFDALRARRKEIYDQNKQGKTYKELAQQYNISRERARDICLYYEREAKRANDRAS